VEEGDVRFLGGQAGGALLLAVEDAQFLEEAIPTPRRPTKLQPSPSPVNEENETS